MTTARSREVGGPLSGLHVVDLTQVLSGPFWTMLLADLGADVVRVEPPAATLPGHGTAPARDRSTGPDVRGYFASVNRIKRSICLDLTTASGRGDLLELLAQADVLVENSRVEVMDRLGLSYELLHERFPNLVYARIRGFGIPAPDAARTRSGRPST